MHASPSAMHRRAVAIWLLVCCAMVFGMIVVGGTTRLTSTMAAITADGRKWTAPHTATEGAQSSRMKAEDE